MNAYEWQLYPYLDGVMNDPSFTHVKLTILCNSNGHFNVYVTGNNNETLLSGTGYTTLEQALMAIEAQAKETVGG